MKVSDELELIREKYGKLTPSLVVQEASDPEHPLHDRFVWDDATAAHRYRLDQARHLIISVEVMRESVGDETVLVRAYVSARNIGVDIEDEDSSDGIYLPVEDVMAFDVTRTLYFQTLEREWKRLKKRAGDNKLFAAMVMDDIRDLIA